MGIMKMKRNINIEFYGIQTKRMYDYNILEKLGHNSRFQIMSSIKLSILCSTRMHNHSYKNVKNVCWTCEL